MGQFIVQFFTIFKKNFLLGWRSREIIYEIFLPLLAGFLMVVKNVIFPVQFLAPMIVALSINVSSRALLIKLVEEKREKFKETQKIMGLNTLAYGAAWFTSGLLRTALGGVLFLLPPLLIVSKVDTSIYNFEFFDMNDYMGMWDLYYGSNLTRFIIIYALYVVTSVVQAFAISTLFSEPKLAGEVTTFVTTLSTLLSFLVFSPSFVETPFWFIIISLSPQACVAFGYMSCISNPIYHDNFELVNDSLLMQYPSSTALWQMSSLVILYSILYIYLDHVTPNEFGVAGHPLLCLKRGKNQNKNDIQASALQDDVSSAVYHQKFNNIRNSKKTVEIRDLKKYFGQTKAVNGVTLSLYNKNIFCLLGHNGSGKTTTISVLTGLIEKTQGQILIDNMELEDNLRKIRKQIGICQQKEVLYEQMTFEEHLYFIGRIKGIKSKDLKEAVEEVIQMTKTENERKKLSSNLSGGNKRKLSLGMALIGGSKIVFLDEPTSGIDAISRRSIWEILEKVRNEERTIILTTHHLDEAEVLADRIGILSKGQLLAVGDVNYIKRNFGVGYTLTLFTDHKKSAHKKKKRFSTKQKNEIVDLVQKIIPDSIQNPQSNKNYLIFQIPFHARDNFEQLFTSLETKDIIVNLELNTLEDAFVNIGMEEHDLLDQGLLSKSGIKDKQKNADSDALTGQEALAQQSAAASGSSKNQVVTEANSKAHDQISSNSTSQQQPQNQSKGQNEIKFTNFDQIKKPKALNKKPSFNFLSQFTACFLRKFYTTIRNFTNYVSFGVPLFLMILTAEVLSNTPDIGPDKLTLMGIFLGVAYSFNGGIYVVQPVQEREENLKYALNVMGCRISAYWLGTFVFDFIVYFLTVVIFIIYASGQEFMDPYTDKIMGSLTIFGCSFISFSYLCGYLLFKKSASAMKGFPAINFFIIFILPWSLLGGMYYLNYKDIMSWEVYLFIQRYLTFVFFLYSPLFVLYSAFSQIAPKSEEEDAFSIPFYSYSSHQSFYNLVLLGQFVIYSLFTIYLEYRQYDLKPEDQSELQKKMKLNKIADKNVQFEKQRVLYEEKEELLKKLDNSNNNNNKSNVNNNNNNIQKSQIKSQNNMQNQSEQSQDLEKQSEFSVYNPNERDKIIVRNLWKKYDNNYVALKDVNYGVKKGEIMGLLGPNGAGKSTSFNVLSALIPRTLGSVKIKGTEVNKGIMSIYQDVGICPQFDCVWRSLTPTEHLYIFGRMKGLRGKDLDECVNYFLEVTQLKAFTKTKAGNLSGGNKRKLCVANALIGGPDIQFFDEPSSGVDPIARRFLWNTLKQATNQRESAIVLTTHTMQEAESLCTKIGILINGRLYCIGSPQQLRAEYGNGFNITFEGVMDENRDKVSEIVLKYFSRGQVLLDARPGFAGYQIPNDDFKFSTGYKMAGQLIKLGLVEDFMIQQASLEQVFVRFSQLQKHNEQMG